MAEQTVAFSLRLNADVKEKLERLAEADHRSLNSYISRVLEEHVIDPAERKRLELVLRAAHLLGDEKKGKRK